MKNFSSRVAFSFLALALLALPHTVLAKSKNTTSDATATVSVTPPDVPSDITVPVSTAASSVAPVAPPTPKATTVVPTADTLTVGELTVKDPEITFKSDHIDLTFSIKNASKGDERLGGADTTWKNSSIVEVTKDKDGKEVEGPISEPLPAGKTVEFTKSDKWLRIKVVQTEPKNADVVQVTMYFRRSPNAVLKIAINPGKATKASSSGDSGKSSSGVMDWLKH
jgi:copper(I)-binding protein